MPRGGYREKSAFKKGNMAALKHGRYSKQLEELLKGVPGESAFMIDKKEGLQIFHLERKKKQ